MVDHLNEHSDYSASETYIDEDLNYKITKYRMDIIKNKPRTLVDLSIDFIKIYDNFHLVLTDDLKSILQDSVMIFIEEILLRADHFANSNEIMESDIKTALLTDEIYDAVINFINDM